uniref:Uncharacterized protein n=1 Tax=Eutreptiella gymnastica TaxID=73025 RepID=A0A7S4GN55_9EUGL
MGWCAGTPLVSSPPSLSAVFFLVVACVPVTDYPVSPLPCSAEYLKCSNAAVPQQPVDHMCVFAPDTKRNGPGSGPYSHLHFRAWCSDGQATSHFWGTLSCEQWVICIPLAHAAGDV